MLYKKPGSLLSYKGFTLIELLVVMVILAILATVGFVQYSGVSTKAGKSEKITEVKSIANALESNYNPADGTYPSSLQTSWFTDNVIPMPPDGGNYYVSYSPGNTGYRVCTNLDGLGSCNATSPTCVCHDSTQGRYVEPPATPTPSPSPSPSPSGPVWNTAIALSNFGGFYVDIIASGSNVHAIFGDGAVYYRRSTDDGNNWNSTTQIANGSVYLPDMISVSGTNVYAFYLSNLQSFSDNCCPRTGGDIFFKRSTNNGTSWGSEVQLTSSGRAFRVSTAAAGSNVYVTWMDFRSGTWDVYYRRSTDNGASWGAETVLVSGTVVGDGAGRPQIAAKGNSVHLSWMHPGSGTSSFSGNGHIDVFYKRSLDGGATWGSNVNLTPEITHSLRQDIAVNDNNNVLMVWDDDRNGSQRAFMKVSSDNGSNWSAPMQLSFDSSGADHVFAEGAGTLLHAGWADNLGNYQYRLSQDGGATWGTAEYVAATASMTNGIGFFSATPSYLHAIWGDSGDSVWYRRRSLP